MIFKPIFYTTLMKIMLDVAWQGHYTLFWFEFSEANAALVLICEALGTPLDLEHGVEHLCCFSVFLTDMLCSLKPIIEEVWDETGKENCADYEDDGWKCADYEGHMIN